MDLQLSGELSDRDSGSRVLEAPFFFDEPSTIVLTGSYFWVWVFKIATSSCCAFLQSMSFNSHHHPLCLPWWPSLRGRSLSSLFWLFSLAAFSDIANLLDSAGNISSEACSTPQSIGQSAGKFNVDSSLVSLGAAPRCKNTLSTSPAVTSKGLNLQLGCNWGPSAFTIFSMPSKSLCRFHQWSPYSSST